MKIYVAGPMTGIPHFNFPLFYKVAAKLRAQGHEVFNPAERDNDKYGVDISNPTGDPIIAAKEHNFSLREALADDTQYICRYADAIYMLPGWEKSHGARAEHALAIALHHKIIYSTED
jgi:hypothetical protein